ncbi:MAG: metallophosphoesterase [Acidimicrobiia bacterium]|nr:metallophosphoesterase [Acidimicrobiia bacterium]
MLLVSDVHGAATSLRRVADQGEPVLILGDFLNFVDYRTGEGMVADVLGYEFSARFAELRAVGDYVASRELWVGAAEQVGDLRELFRGMAVEQYRSMAGALEGASGYAIFGNVDIPPLLETALPSGFEMLHGEAVEIEGRRVGFVGGAMASPMVGNTAITEEEMEALLAQLGPVDVLCTHVPPAIDPLRTDVITGRRERASRTVLEYVETHQPEWHFFGDVHQPQAQRWTVGRTTCQNLGYFRATGRAFRLDNAG